jgi:putative Mg2+ transporter-C (MgtC) family protein
MLVAAGSACLSMASIYGFDRLTNQADLARVAASVVTGVGFLGAGTILRDGSTIRGLTSASSIWIVASIGMLSGLGMILLAVYTTFLTWFVLAVVKRFKHTPKKNPPRLVNQKGLLNPKQLSVEEHDPHED